MKLYVASSWRNEHQPAVVTLLRQNGHEVYDFREPVPGDHGFAWSDLDPEWQSWTPRKYVEALMDPRACDGFLKDWTGMTNAEACVLVLPCGRSAHLEAGYFVGARKPLVIFYPNFERCEPELMYKMARRVITTDHELVDYLKDLPEIERTIADVVKSERDRTTERIRQMVLGCSTIMEVVDTLDDLRPWPPAPR